jgi:cytoskeletal protein RodZ
MNQETEKSQDTFIAGVIHIGDYLKNCREGMKVSLEKVSQKTKINLNVLRALEANDFKSLPSPAYIKGFVLSYARVIRLSPEDVITKLEYSYLTLVGKPFPALNHTKTLPEKTKTNPAIPDDPAKVLEADEKVQERKKLIVPSLVFAAILIVFVSLYNVLNKTIKSESQGTKPQPVLTETAPPSLPVSDTSAATVDASPSPTEVTPPPITAAGISNTKEVPKVEIKTEVKVEPKVEPKVEVRAEVKPEPKLTPSAPKATVANQKRIFPTKEFRKISLKLFAFSNEDLGPVISEEARSKFDKSLQNVYINAVDGSTWVTVKVDDKKIQTYPLPQGKDLFLQGKKILLYFGNVRVTRVYYQNKLLDTPTPTGYKSLVFPESETKNHMLPLFPRALDNNLYTAEEYMDRMKAEEEAAGATVTPL